MRFNPGWTALQAKPKACDAVPKIILCHSESHATLNDGDMYQATPMLHTHLCGICHRTSNAGASADLALQTPDYQLGLMHVADH